MAVKRGYIQFKNGDCKMCGKGFGLMFNENRVTTTNKSHRSFNIYYDNKHTYPFYRGDDIRRFVKTVEVHEGDIIYTLKNGAYCMVESIAHNEKKDRTFSYFKNISSRLDGKSMKEAIEHTTDGMATVLNLKQYDAKLKFINQYGDDITSKLHKTFADTLVTCNDVTANNMILSCVCPNDSNPELYTSVNSILTDVVKYNNSNSAYYSAQPDILATPSANYFGIGWGNGAGCYEFAKYTNNLLEKDEGEDTGGESTSGGQNGNFDDTSDNIEPPTLPVTNASSCGMVKMYELDLGQTKALASYLWSGAKEFYENITKMFNDPMDSIVSLSLAPIKPNVSAQTTVEICKYAIDSVTGFPLTSQYVSLDCGTVIISPYWGNALDYAPYTKASIYLPFIGTQELNIDDVMNRTVGVIYNIDLLSGACACMITCDGSVMYNFSGNVISQIPVSGKNALEMYKSVISAVTNTALAVGTGAGGVALAGDVVSNGLSVMGSKMTVQRGGTISATNGVLGVKFPYITILRANQSLPADFHYFKGYPSNISGKVSSFSGYTEVEYVHVTGINATENELEMIERILKEGFII